jgi:hypothetical protein
MSIATLSEWAKVLPDEALSTANESSYTYKEERPIVRVEQFIHKWKRTGATS